jgi:hypothetical protein
MVLSQFSRAASPRIARLGERAAMPFSVHPQMLRHARDCSALGAGDRGRRVPTTVRSRRFRRCAFWRAGAAAAYENGRKERIVIVEYPSLENATAARESAAYGEALKALGDSAVRDVRIVEGLE